MHSITSQRLLLFLLLLTSTCHPASAAWIFKIGPYEEICLLVRAISSTSGTDTGQQDQQIISSTKILSGNYEMLDPRISAEFLLVYVMQGDTVVWHSKPNAPYDRFHIPLQDHQRYWICLQNSMHGPLSEGHEEAHHADGIVRYVGFNYRVHVSSRPVSVSLSQQEEEKFYDWLDKSNDITDGLSDFQDHFNYIKAKEAEQRSLVEATFSACLTWTFLEAAMVVCMALGQVLFYRRYLEKQQTGFSNYYHK
jgi:hypothetical protein